MDRFKKLGINIYMSNLDKNNNDKKKILLVTLQDQNNFGNRLQNYALQTVLQDMDYEVTTPFYPPYVPNYGSQIKIFLKKILYKLGQNKHMRVAKSTTLDKNRKDCFIDFDKKYISNRVAINMDNMEEFSTEEYNYAITGSDQVWHHWRVLGDKELDYFYLEFMPEDKRISYAASFGFSKVPKDDMASHTEGLKGMHSISCREKRGCEIVKELSGRDATLLPDPTFLLNFLQWERIGQKPEWSIKGPYLLRFFLGNLTSEYEKATKKFARERGLKIIDIYDIRSKKYSKVGPSEFIWLISNADYICTDSFHACVFSIIFHRDFTAFRRIEMFFGDMFGRIDTLLTNTGLREAIFDPDDVKDNRFSDKSWEIADESMKTKAEIGRAYLRENLK